MLGSKLLKPKEIRGIFYVIDSNLPDIKKKYIEYAVFSNVVILLHLISMSNCEVEKILKRNTNEMKQF